MTNIEDAVRQAIEVAPARKFSESIDLAINLHNIDLSLPANRVDVEIILPHGVGKPAKIAVFAAERLLCGPRVPVQIVSSQAMRSKS